VDPNTQGSDLWLYDRGRRVDTRITSSRSIVAAPLWISDRELVVTEVEPANPSSPPQLAVRTLGAAQPRFLLRREGVSYPTSLTPSRSHVVYTIHRGNERGFDIEMVSLGSDAKQTPLLSSEYDERDGRISPDGRWLAFESDESGQPDVFIAPIAHLAERVRVSSDGGTEARWSADGRELYFLSATGTLTAASMDANGNVGQADPLFPVRSASLAEFGEFGQTRYQPMRDGKFVVREPVEAAIRAPIVVMIRQ
jgi:Tol biopolymer transport system component